MEKNSNPNILFILIDDMGWRDLSCYGSTFYETPHIDQLAKDGIKFTQAYAACPVCSPTRASILTGKYPATLNITNFIPGQAKGKLIEPYYIHYLPLEEKTIAKALKEAGYRTYHVGKWHLGKEPYWPEHHGFDVNIAGCEWGAPRTYFAPYKNPRLKEGPKGEYLTDRLTNEAINLIKQNGDQPFFMYFAHYAVHIPIQVPSKYIKKYELKRKSLGLDKIKTIEVGERFPMESKKFKRLTRRLIQSDPNYAAMIENLDENIGKLLNVLEETGKSENTVVFFTSDNGGLSTAESCPTTNKPLHEGKGWMYEGGVREPLIIRWPKVIKRGSICEIPITSPDFYPTILEIANLSLNPSQHCDGVSFLSVLKGNPNLERGPIFWHYPHYGNQGGTPGSIIRNGDFKLIEFFEDHHIELYNLKEDIGEKYNIASDNPEIVAKLKKELEIWRKSTEAKYPEPNPNYNPEPKDFREKLRLLYWNLVYKLEIFKNNHKTTLKD